MDLYDTDFRAMPRDPFVLEAEASLLGAAMVNNQAIDVAAALVSPDDFYDGLHARFWETMLDLRTRGTAVDPITLTAEIGDAVIGEIKLSQYLVRLMVEATTVINAPDYARLIRREALHRKLQSATELGDVGSARDAIQALEAWERAGPAQIGFREALQRAIAQAQSGTTKPAGISTGFRDLDRVTGGYVPSDLIIVPGRPGMGKSSLLASSARQSARKAKEQNAAVALLSLEGSLEQVSHRMLADASWTRGNGIPYTKWRIGGDWSDEEIWRLQEAQAEIDALPLYVDGQAGMSMAAVVAYVRALKRKLDAMGQRLAVLMIDQLGWMDLPARYSGQRHLELGEVTRGLKELAQREEVAVVLAHQLSRQVENRENKRPQLSDLRESGHIEQDADIVIAPYREAYYLEKPCDDPEQEAERIVKLEQARNALEIHILKDRHGATGLVRLFTDMPCCVLRDGAFGSYGAA